MSRLYKKIWLWNSIVDEFLQEIAMMARSKHVRRPEESTEKDAGL